MDEKQLMPIEQKTVLFYDDQITAVLLDVDDEPTVYVPVRQICDFMGIQWAAQNKRIKRDPILAEEIRSVSVMDSQSSPAQNRAMSCLPLKYIPGWLFGISALRVKGEMQDKILRYQRECYDVLWEAFQERRLTSEISFTELLNSDSPAAQAYQMAHAMMQMAKQQLILESQIQAYGSRIDNHETRLEEVESKLGDPRRVITPEQATNISQAVKAIALVLGETSGRNEYAGVYGELYRRYAIPTYRELPATKYAQAIAWLRQWWERLTDGADVPF